MTLHEMKNDAVSLEDLIPRLDRLLELFDMQLNQSTETLSLMRTKVNGLMYSGTAVFEGAAGAWRWRMSPVVPFASIGFSDSQSMGPFVIANSADAGDAGPGTYTTAIGASGEIPMIGTTLSITSTAATQPRLFVAVFATANSLRIN